MRNAILLPNGLVLTTDNSAGIGEKEQDIVATADEVVSYFAARVALLEQWAAGAQPVTIIVHNFSGYKSWGKYVVGIEKIFHELDLPCPAITGSTESNMETLQSAMAITMVGEMKPKRDEEIVWFVYGKPCVGEEVLLKSDQIADLKKIWDAKNTGLVRQTWPVGSTGLAAECQRLGLTADLEGWDKWKSAGPATSVLLGIPEERIEEAKVHFGKYFVEIS